MIAAIVTQQVADQFQNYQVGVNAVRFFELPNNEWFAPIEMVELMPEVFTDYETRDLGDYTPSEDGSYNPNGWSPKIE